ncbi:hypothetical protein ACPOL_0584 [Acidisarcina polymorpha]|uniref:Uncharacterized protein n=1 Tax=Acidisarcina polymorpha TaxID=2211140 RepID=A0A2Z5FTW9_9BACT|nr:hypothetical protein ACPOL_0584 [Acidisarcina polymorpha]
MPIIYEGMSLHAGLIFIDVPAGLPKERQSWRSGSFLPSSKNMEIWQIRCYR